MAKAKVVAALFTLVTFVASGPVAHAADDPLVDGGSAGVDADAGVLDPHALLAQAASLTYEKRLVDALKLAKAARQRALSVGDAEVATNASELMAVLNEKIPRVTFAPPAGVTDLSVTFDGRPVPNESLTRKFSVDPGTHRVQVFGTRDGTPVWFVTDLELGESELRTIDLPVVPYKPRDSREAPACFLSAKDQAELDECLKTGTIKGKSGCGACAIGTGSDTSSGSPLLLLAALVLVARRWRWQ